jgi:hypothetical protein
METPNKHRTPRDVVRVNDILSSALYKRPDGMYAYVAGMNDKAVAERSGLPAAKVRNIRMSLYGKVKGWERRERAASERVSNKSRLDTIEAKLDEALSILRTLV